MALLTLAAEHGVGIVLADTTDDNIASQRTLVRAGFTQVEADGDLLRYEVGLSG